MALVGPSKSQIQRQQSQEINQAAGNAFNQGASLAQQQRQFRIQQEEAKRQFDEQMAEMQRQHDLATELKLMSDIGQTTVGGYAGAMINNPNLAKDIMTKLGYSEAGTEAFLNQIKENPANFNAQADYFFASGGGMNQPSSEIPGQQGGQSNTPPPPTTRTNKSPITGGFGSDKEPVLNDKTSMRGKIREGASPIRNSNTKGNIFNKFFFNVGQELQLTEGSPGQQVQEEEEQSAVERKQNIWGNVPIIKENKADEDYVSSFNQPEQTAPERKNEWWESNVPVYKEDQETNTPGDDPNRSLYGPQSSSPGRGDQINNWMERYPTTPNLEKDQQGYRVQPGYQAPEAPPLTPNNLGAREYTGEEVDLPKLESEQNKEEEKPETVDEVVKKSIEDSDVPKPKKKRAKDTWKEIKGTVDKLIYGEDITKAESTKIPQQLSSKLDRLVTLGDFNKAIKSEEGRAQIRAQMNTSLSDPRFLEALAIRGGQTLEVLDRRRQQEYLTSDAGQAQLQRQDAIELRKLEIEDKKLDLAFEKLGFQANELDIKKLLAEQGFEVKAAENQLKAAEIALKLLALEETGTAAMADPQMVNALSGLMTGISGEMEQLREKFPDDYPENTRYKALQESWTKVGNKMFNLLGLDYNIENLTETSKEIKNIFNLWGLFGSKSEIGGTYETNMPTTNNMNTENTLPNNTPTVEVEPEKEDTSQVFDSLLGSYVE